MMSLVDLTLIAEHAGAVARLDAALALSLGAFIPHVEPSARTGDARAALARLDSLRFELMPEMRELGGSVAG